MLENMFSMLPGQTRTRVSSDHALIAPDSHVHAPLPDWGDAECVVLISPVMGAAPRGPQFCQYLVDAVDTQGSRRTTAGIERLVYVLEGEATVDADRLAADSFIWLPPGAKYEFEVEESATLLVFDKQYEPLAGVPVPDRVSGSFRDAPSEPFLGDQDAILATLLPTYAGFDMAVNVFTFQAGATLPFVETHVMEHGLYMRSGWGVYRLAEHWQPVQQGDAIWMAPYCPQWFVACGRKPASYIYYKDVNRAPHAG